MKSASALSEAFRTRNETGPFTLEQTFAAGPCSYQGTSVEDRRSPCQGARLLKPPVVFQETKAKLGNLANLSFQSLGLNSIFFPQKITFVL